MSDPAAPDRETLLEVEGLTVWLPHREGRTAVIRDVSFRVGRGEALGIVGESGSGKSMTAKAIDRLLPRGAEVDGSIRYAGEEVSAGSSRWLRTFRKEVAMIFQDPRAHINPVRRVGDFMTEALRLTDRVRKDEAWQQAEQALEEVGIDRPGKRLRQYPHELSGGMLQRVMIAAALLTRPRLLIADEPTTALDVTTQAEVVALLNELRRQLDLAVIFITHDLELASAVCDRTAVMYAGAVVEINSSEHLHADPLHPYTAALAAARPDIDRRSARLRAIPGTPVSAANAPARGCAFASRCVHVTDRCRTEHPVPEQIGPGLTWCHRSRELRGQLEVLGE